jgi:ectoine hydroxylase-related dioxygenase (phytanoyl-CoA dioxygenase family)
VAWHQDTALPIESRVELAGWGPWSDKYGITYAHAPAQVLARIVALRVHLDDSHAENGPLRVLPGTHQLGVLSDTEVSEQARRIEPVECLALAGDVLAMRPLIIHASSKVRGDAPRRVLHIEYAGSLDLGNGLELCPA